MKTIFLLIAVLVLNLGGASIAKASGPQCTGDGAQTMGGVDVWPWSVAKPFPWDNIQGFWKLGDDESSYVRARVLSSTNNRKILSLFVYGDGICSKPFAKGTGYVDVSEKNVVRALLSDGVYKYQMKLGMFDVRDITDAVDVCSQNIMAVSMQLIGRTKKSVGQGTIEQLPIDPSLTETRNMVLKRINIDPSTACKGLGF